MQPIGLIIGHGYAKAESPTAQVVFPAVAAPAVTGDYDTTLGAGRAAVSLNGLGDWLVGDDALLFAPGRLVSLLDRSRYNTPAFLALARAALLKVVSEPGPLTIMTGMPSAWYADRVARSQLAQAVSQAAAPLANGAEVTVRVAPEAAGVYYAYVFERGGLDRSRLAQTVGVIDAGYRDFNVALFSGGRYVAGESVPGGTVEAMREIRRLITAAYGLELSLHEVDAAVREGGVRVDGLSKPLPEGTATALGRLLPTVLAAGRSLWPNGGRSLDVLLLGGGGAPGLEPGLVREFPQQLVTLSRPQLAGPRGFRAMAAATAGV